jgi:membrane-bound serine protease (ClpP class)
MRQRLLIAIVSTLFEEAAFLVVGVWLLPVWGIKIPLAVIITIMAIWLAWSIFTYRKGTRALLRKPVSGLENMVGSTGIVVKELVPDGLIKIKGELWKSHSNSGHIENGTTVVVVAQDRLKLFVLPQSAASDK